MESETLKFVPHRRRKKGVNHNLKVPSFPPVGEDPQRVFHGVWTGLSVEVSDPDSIRQLYENGNYGKGSLSRGAPQLITRKSDSEAIDQDETLVLELEEAFMLAFYQNILKIWTLDGVEMSSEDYFDAAIKLQPLFLETLGGYMYFKSEGWVIKSGMKFGCHFLLYEKGVRFYHASYAVFVTRPFDRWHREAVNLRGMQRVAESAQKDIIFLEVQTPDNFELKSTAYIESLIFDELIVRRFKYTNDSGTK